MELKFLGRGSGFNTKEGNTAAFFIENSNLFLIDCGESVRARIVELDLLKNIQAVYFFCTHTHSDHVGSLGNLILFCNCNLKIPFYVVCPKGTQHQKNLVDLLRIFGCKEQYHLMDINAFKHIRYIVTQHDPKLDEAYGLEFRTPEGIIYYSGDTNSTEQIEFYIKTQAPIFRMYLDTTINEISADFHLSLAKLAKIIPLEMRSKCYCMHVNSDKCIRRAEQLGFNVVKCE